MNSEADELMKQCVAVKISATPLDRCGPSHTIEALADEEGTKAIMMEVT